MRSQKQYLHAIAFAEKIHLKVKCQIVKSLPSYKNTVYSGDNLLRRNLMRALLVAALFS
jgi:hypothetical protein